MKELKNVKLGFLGTGPLAEEALLTLVESGITPKIVITKPDSKVGRKQTLLPPNIVHIAKLYNIEVLQPASLKTLSDDFVEKLESLDLDIFLVASYGNIVPDSILEIPAFGTLNIHPSLLPKYRGPTPIESALLDGEQTLGISIMFLDDKVDHGPILAQESLNIFSDHPDETVEFFEKYSGSYGVKLLVDKVLLPFLEGHITAEEQDHSLATFTKKLTKEDGKVDLNYDSLEKILTVYRACTPWPGCYFVHSHNGKDMRVKISKMSIVGNTIQIDTVIPEGKNEMTFQSFKNGYIK
jgi:methionyl-tRNA formyltransferase